MAEEIQTQPKLDLKVLYDRYGLTIAVTRDWLQVYIAYVPQISGESQPQGNLNVLSEEFVREVLAERKIVFGLQREAISAFVANPPHDTKVLIAQGTPFVPGEDAKVKYVYDKRGDGPSPRPLKGGKVDLKDLDLTLNVRKGDVLARKTPATDGVPGRKVNGEEIPAKRGKDRNLPGGRNTVVSEDGLELLADIDGTVSRVANKISVVEVYTVKGNVDYSTGNIDFVGAVDVSGNLLSGFRIEAKSDVTIHGVVEGGSILSGGNVTVYGGIQGGEKAEIEAKGFIQGKFVNKAKLKAGQSIRFSGPVMHCVLEAGERIELAGRSGVLNGGLARATLSLEAENIGAEMGIATTVEVGVNPESAKRAESLEEELKKARANIGKLSQAVSALNAAKQSRGSLPAGREKMLIDSIKTRYALMATVKQLEKEQEELEKEIVQAEQGHVRARGSIFPGVTVKIGKLNSKVDHEMKNVTLRCEGEEITAT